MTREDAISREWLKTAIHNFYYGLKHTSTEEDIQAYIDAAPSVSTEKIGHWIMPVQDDGMSDPIYYQVRCSECGFDLDPQTWHQELHQYGADKYCPKCGCRMMEVEE